ncbi:MAG: hypothetical protein KIT54_08405 [Phycisphaeraceae bacterium]|nr:hypothetical protein [Phycisphaeraceae bacterium]
MFVGCHRAKAQEHGEHGNHGEHGRYQMRFGRTLEALAGLALVPMGGAEEGRN